MTQASPGMKKRWDSCFATGPPMEIIDMLVRDLR